MKEGSSLEATGPRLAYLASVVARWSGHIGKTLARRPMQMAPVAAFLGVDLSLSLRLPFFLLIRAHAKSDICPPARFEGRNASEKKARKRLLFFELSVQTCKSITEKASGDASCARLPLCVCPPPCWDTITMASQSPQRTLCSVP